MGRKYYNLRSSAFKPCKRGVYKARCKGKCKCPYGLKKKKCVCRKHRAPRRRH